MPFVEVAVNSGLPHRQTFSYAVPTEMTLAPGDAVLVPFGRRTLQGIVMEVVEVPAFPDPKPVQARLGHKAVISPQRVALARWLADFYLAPLFSAVALMLPPGFERRPLTNYEPLVSAAELPTLTLPPRQRAVLAYLVESGSQEQKAIERAFGARPLMPARPGSARTATKAGAAIVSQALSQLVQRGLIRRSYALARPSVRAKTVRVVELAVGPHRAAAAAQEMAARRRGRAAAALRALAEAPGALTASELRVRASAGSDVLAQLVAADLVRVREEHVERDPLAGRRYEHRPAPPLTAEQAAAFAPVARALREGAGASFLLHGVTGSGKTEVYLKALAETVALGKRAIVLVPEIALTPQTVRRFAERFPGQVAVLHSGLSQGELFDQWHGIDAGRYAVVIGSRSAVFAPQPDLGLIVIDEEHEWTYKQQDQAPRYDAREVAERLAELTGAVLLLGSATPDVVSYQRALWGRHRLLQLKERVRPVVDAAGRAIGVSASTVLPPVEVVDMREELKGGNRSIFSRSLQLGLYQALQRREQAILFLNRRGTAGFLQCRDCGFVPHCPSCAIALGHHRHLLRQGGEAERLLCHQCNRSRSVYERCPMCGGSRLRPMGLGVEAVEEAVRELLPEARTLRWDRDVTQGRHAHEEILASFLRGEADVLIGTQMVAKGLDLPAVTIVGVISADIGLHIPDFRAAERTFQLLTQVAGRAGRVMTDGAGAPRGRVVIQTYTPDSYAIVAAARHDYEAFFEQEIELRRKEAYPPFLRLATLVYAHTDADRGLRQAESMARTLRARALERGLPGVEVLGPAPPYVPKWHGRTRWQITLRTPEPAALLQDLPLPEGWVLDIDPASLA